jgi:hypothetical protein
MTTLGWVFIVVLAFVVGFALGAVVAVTGAIKYGLKLAKEKQKALRDVQLAVAALDKKASQA